MEKTMADNGAAKPFSATDRSGHSLRDFFARIESGLGDAAANAVAAQQQAFVTAQAATTMGVATLYAVDTGAVGLATKSVLDEASTGTGE
jgi:hypothetical protein